MAAVTICSDLGAHKNKIWHCFHCFPIYFLWSGGTRCHDLHFWMLSFKPTFSHSTFTFIKRLFSSSSLSAIRVMSSAYQVIDISPSNLDSSCVSSSPAFLMMYSAYKLNKQGDKRLCLLAVFFRTVLLKYSFINSFVNLHTIKSTHCQCIWFLVNL